IGVAAPVPTRASPAVVGPAIVVAAEAELHLLGERAAFGRRPDGAGAAWDRASLEQTFIETAFIARESVERMGGAGRSSFFLPIARGRADGSGPHPDD